MPRRFMGVALALLAAAAIVSATNEEGKKFLEENAKKEGVITLPSGLQYKVLTKGGGVHHPTADSSCDCHYAGTLIDGTEFDSSYKRGSSTAFAPNQVIKGWTEAMQLMVEGDKWEMYIPSELAYGERGSPPKIKGGDALIFQMELVKIKGDKVPAIKCDYATQEGCDEKEVAYINQVKTFSPEKVAVELKRLAGLKTVNMKPDLAAWVQRRTNILKQVGSNKEDL